MRAHLPAATDYPDRDALRDVRTADLVVMLDECTVWAEDVEHFRNGLKTPAAQTLWRVLVVDETKIVAKAVLRIVAEINERNDSYPLSEPAEGGSVAKAFDQHQQVAHRSPD